MAFPSSALSLAGIGGLSIIMLLHFPHRMAASIWLVGRNLAEDGPNRRILAMRMACERTGRKTSGVSFFVSLTHPYGVVAIAVRFLGCPTIRREG
jgi:hypothetical protein